jgi:hypothetical protein
LYGFPRVLNVLSSHHAQFGVLVLNWGDFKRSSREERVRAQKETQMEPKDKDSLYSKVMGQSMWPLSKNKEKVVSHP